MTKPRYLAVSLCLGLASLAFAGAAQATTIITTEWNTTKLTQDECLAHAAAAIPAGGFQSLPNTATTRHGKRGEYTVAVRCLADKGVVFFVVAGPTSSTDRYMDDIHKHF